MQGQMTHRCEAEDSGERLDLFWARHLRDKGISRSRIKKWILEGRALVNKAACHDPGYAVNAGDLLELEAELEERGLSPDPQGLDIRWQNEDLAVVNKPAGISVHPGAGDTGSTTLVNRLLHHFPGLSESESERPGIVHRLDKDTSGLMMVALSNRGEWELSRQLAERQVRKEYLALVIGCPDPPSGDIDVPIGRDPVNRHRMKADRHRGREARSSYSLLRYFPDKEVSLIRVAILTGRTHQIRVHMARIGHPLLGDKLYGPQAMAWIKKRLPAPLHRLLSRHMLHSWKLGLYPPQGQQMQHFTQPPPRDFWRLLLHLEKGTQRVAVTGALGSGKSALTGLVSGGIMPVWSADEAVARLYEPGQAGWEMLRRSFGERFVPESDAPVDKARLFREMSQSESLRREVQSLVHPLVFEDLRDFFNSKEGVRMALAEIPLLAESGRGAKSLFHVVVGVHCPDEMRRHWLARDRGLDPETVRGMESWQLPQEEKLRQADVVVTNPGSWQGLQEVALRLGKILARLRRRRMLRFFQWLLRQELAPLQPEGKG